VCDDLVMSSDSTIAACADSGVKSFKDVSVIGLQPKVSSAPVDSDGCTTVVHKKKTQPRYPDNSH
jgi:hypothetical protein